MIALQRRVRRTVARLLGRPPRPVPVAAANSLVAPGNQWYRPAVGGASTFADFIVGGDVVRQAFAVLERLSPDVYLDFVRDYYTAGLSRFGDRWRYADINTALIGAGRILQPERYLEIGVRRGRSAAMLASCAPACDIVACDLWVPGYGGMPTPGPEVVREQLAAVGHRGQLEFLSGDSHMLLPRYFREHPHAFFDLITVDGDHSTAGARGDLLCVMPRLKIGGVLVFDDIVNPAHPKLRRVWNTVVGRDPRFSTFVFDEVGFGVAVAVRMR